MKRVLLILLAALLAFPTAATSAASDSVPDPWTMFVGQLAKDLGVSYDRAEDKIEAFFRCGDGSCRPEVEEWHRLAIEAGWPESDWTKLSRVIYRESHGQPDVIYYGGRGRRPGGTGRNRPKEWSIGLLQLNTLSASTRAWYESLGYTRDNLLDPATNLRAGRALYVEAVRLYGNGWRPWGIR